MGPPLEGFQGFRGHLVMRVDHFVTKWRLGFRVSRPVGHVLWGKYYPIDLSFSHDTPSSPLYHLHVHWLWEVLTVLFIPKQHDETCITGSMYVVRADRNRTTKQKRRVTAMRRRHLESPRCDVMMFSSSHTCTMLVRSTRATRMSLRCLTKL